MPMFRVRINRKDGSVRSTFDGSKPRPGRRERLHVDYLVSASGPMAAEEKAKARFSRESQSQELPQEPAAPPSHAPGSQPEEPVGETGPVNGTLTTQPIVGRVEWQPMSANKELTPEERRAIISEGIMRGFEIANAVWKLVKKYGVKDITVCLNNLAEAMGQKEESVGGNT